MHYLVVPDEGKGSGDQWVCEHPNGIFIVGLGALGGRLSSLPAGVRDRRIGLPAFWLVWCPCCVRMSFVGS